MTTTFQVQYQFSAVLCLTCHSLTQMHCSPPPPQGFFAWDGQHLTLLGFYCAVLTFVSTRPNSPASGLSLQDFPHNYSPGHFTLLHGYKYHLYADNSYNYISSDLSYSQLLHLLTYSTFSPGCLICTSNLIHPKLNTDSNLSTNPIHPQSVPSQEIVTPLLQLVRPQVITVIFDIFLPHTTEYLIFFL